MTHTFYTGVGNRKVPREALDLCREVGRELALRGLTLRTGEDKGTAQEFHAGACDTPDGQVTVYRAKDVSLTRDAWAFDIAVRAVGSAAWLRYGHNERLLCARSVMQVLGHDGQTPSKFLLCWLWSADPRMQDGTRVAARVADDYWNCRSTMPDGVVDVELAGTLPVIPWLNLKGLTLADALAFAHQHAGVPVLRPGDVLSARLVPDGAFIIERWNPEAASFRAFSGGRWLRLDRTGDHASLFETVLPGTALPPGEISVIALGLTQETATADNLRRLAQEYEERKAQ